VPTSLTSVASHVELVVTVDAYGASLVRSHRVRACVRCVRNYKSTYVVGTFGE
jgi:hypothetical protein